MSYADDVKAVLVADVGAGGAATLLAGGIYTFDETGQSGLSRINTPDAFSGNALLPTCVVKSRSQVPDGGIVDAELQTRSYRQMVEVWLYDDAYATYSTIDTIWQRVFELLEEQAVGASSEIARWQGNTVDMRDPALENVIFRRNDFEFRGLMQPSS